MCVSPVVWFSPFQRRAWSNLLLGLLDDLDQTPPLGSGKRAGLHHYNEVADACRIGLIVSLDLGRTAQDLAVERVLDAVLDLYGDGLVHLVGRHVTATRLAIRAVFGRGR